MLYVIYLNAISEVKHDRRGISDFLLSLLDSTRGARKLGKSLNWLYIYKM